MELTFLAVHAHPDDEASSTGGTLRVLADQGVRTVLVTCTNGEYGDAPGGAKPDADHHDPDEVARVRALELDESVRLLGVARSVRLGYRDSGMKGWPQNDDPAAFWATPVDAAASRLARIMEEERPQVVVTYNEIGFYGHPDHVQAHRITLRALEMIDDGPTLYYNAVPNSIMDQMRARWAEEARRQAEAEGRADEPDPDDDAIDLGTPDDQIGATIDVSGAVAAKRAALAAHASQIAESFWLRMSEEEFARAMGYEWFVRATNPRGLSGNVTDIFAGYR
jgi:LmbE family N-acetylglucosaminyl deacetylase